MSLLGPYGPCVNADKKVLEPRYEDPTRGVRH